MENFSSKVCFGKRSDTTRQIVEKYVGFMLKQRRSIGLTSSALPTLILIVFYKFHAPIRCLHPIKKPSREVLNIGAFRDFISQFNLIESRNLLFSS
jgi:hypothetical protein